MAITQTFSLTEKAYEVMENLLPELGVKNKSRFVSEAIILYSTQVVPEDESERLFKEFIANGYAKQSNGLSAYLNAHPDSCTWTHFDEVLFGKKRLRYTYLAHNPIWFIDFLVSKLPEYASAEQKKMLTDTLHLYKLHWEQCGHSDEVRQAQNGEIR